MADKKRQNKLARISSGFSGRKLALQKEKQREKAKEQQKKREKAYLDSLK